MHRRDGLPSAPGADASLRSRVVNRGARGALVIALALGLGGAAAHRRTRARASPRRRPRRADRAGGATGRCGATRPARRSRRRARRAITPTTVKQLRLRWFFNSRDVVTASRRPLVAGRSTSATGPAASTRSAPRDGKPRWTFQAKPQRLVYSGQIVASAAVADVRGVRTVFVPSGKTMYALRASDGHELWRHALGRRGDKNDPTEIESSPVVVDGKVIFGWDVHNSGKGYPAGAHRARRPDRPASVWKLVTAPSSDDADAADPRPTGAGLRRRLGLAVGRPLAGARRSSGRATAPTRRELGPLQRRDVRGRPRDRRAAVDVPAAPVEPRRPRLRRRAEPDRHRRSRSSPDSGTRTARTTSSTA